jgi:hypothetical protein
MNLNLKKKMVLTIFVFVISLSYLWTTNHSQKVAVLREVVKPDMMLVKNNKLYVLEKTSIFIYSLKEFHLLKKFGRQGEGPGEFIARPFGPPMTLSFHADYLLVNSNNRMSYFTLDGEYVKEEKSPPNTVFYRVKQGYLGIGAAAAENNRAYICFRLFDMNFQNPKMLYQSEISVGQGIEFLLPMNSLNNYPIYKGNIFFVAGRKGFVIDCLDHTGKKLYSIEKKHDEKVKVTETYKKSTLNWFQKHPTFKQIFPQIRSSIIFKDYFPAVKSFSVDNDLLYVITNKTRNELWECIVMNLKGKELKRVFVPLPESEPYTYYPLLYSIEKGKFYALMENEDDETWELHMKTIK